MSSWSEASYFSDYSETNSEDARNCRVSGCRKKHVYASFGTERIYSRYCYRHTCTKTLSIKDGYHCPNPKLESDKYCTQHMRCGEPSCSRLGEYAGSTGHVQWFCRDHRCTAPTCRSGVHFKAQQRCKEHLQTCIFDGCTRPCHEHRDGRLDVVCAAHYGVAKCAFDGCTRRKPGYDAKFCLDHRCAVPGCVDSRDDGGILCFRHRCSAGTCAKAVSEPSDPESLFCREHACTAYGCNYARQGLTSFCNVHRCRVEGCRGEARSRNGYCAQRHACADPGCSRPRMSVVVSSSLSRDQGSIANAERCLEHERAYVRRVASAELRAEYGAERQDKFSREKKRFSDDLEGLRKKERERKVEESDKYEDPYKLYPEWRTR